MFNIAKITRSSDEEGDFDNRRKIKDRRVSREKTRFPFIDDNHKLVMKDRRVGPRRESDEKFSDKSLKAVGKILKK